MTLSPYIKRMRKRVGHDLLLLPTVAVLPRDHRGRILLVRQIDTGQWGTIGGSLAHGDPASDLPAVVLAAEGTIVARGAGGEREIAAADFFRDYLETTLAADEVITEIRLPGTEGWSFGYEKFNRRREDWAMVAVCALLRVEGGACADVRIGLTHMGSTPLRATAVEDALRGQPLTADTIAAAAENAAEGTEPPSDLNASQDYKRHLARVLTKRALTAAASQ